jgi:hypothetical protein
MALEIVNSLDSTQHWSTQGKKARQNYTKLLNDDFTAQTSLASSYRFMQVTYVTAITKLQWSPPGFQNPSLLFDTANNIALAGGTLALGSQYVASVFAQDNANANANPSMAFANPTTLINSFYDAWRKYNGAVSYPPKVAAQIPTYSPTQASSIF